jgi:bifunctional DNA-binding transcriptional regulator/antitoxin component of YhaV-PrlF toxin-antitoxin module
MVVEVRKRKRGFTRLTSKYQATIPRAAADAAGITPGDFLRVEVVGDGRVMVTREDDPVAALAEVGRRYKIHYPPDYLKRLRAEWD